MENATFETMRAVKENYHSVAMKIPGVHATSIGRKQVNGEFTDTIAICIHMMEKRPLNQIPEAERIPQEIEGFPTDIHEDSPPELCADVDERTDKVGGGAPIVAAGYALGPGFKGTLGCYVVDSKDNKTVYGLTCKHVFGGYSKIFEPNNNNDCNMLGDKELTCSDVDAGIFILGSWRWKNEIYQIGPVAGTRTITYMDFGKKVVKQGGTTGLTNGEINNIDYSGIGVDGTYIYDTIIIDPTTKNSVFGDNGDSGSAVVYVSTEKGMEGNFVTGLLFAKSNPTDPNPNRCYVVPIDRILVALKVDIVDYQNVGADNDTLDGKIEAVLCQSARGKEYWELYREHFSTVIEKFSSVPRLHATWLKIPGADFIGAVQSGLRDPDSKIPSTLGDMDTAIVLETLRDVLTGHVETGDNLSEQLSFLTDDLKANIGKSWREAFADKQPIATAA